MDMDRIKEVIDLMREHELWEFSIEEKDIKLSLKRGQPGQMMAAPLAPAPAPAPAPAAPPPPPEEELTPIPSPLVGTFYRATSPDADPFVAVGSRVNKDTVVCIIEAMKVMNEIKAETSGVITKILLENASAVQFGQPMFLIEKG
ncbi:MAG: acetyl-CoA carboxylase biotin carboxyl carrier protein [Kiritimatiellae bacterium]|jgi:acetyl-CoA carboxylase biotin carboxyl carrier protein|nr:acetyl-CoA carboxylase biotin carboxyl carrier protein [Kiritimatiellia bacterium]MDY0150379.1 acetyl-CoA carboxylase biotin carboxyl carrier protein [Kiritimatiellia bacterium]